MSTPRADLLPGAEPWESGDGPAGVLVVHGFTGNPQSMRPLAEAFAAAGLAVSLPLLPGHGTRVEDMLDTGWADWSAAAEAAYDRLAARCAAVAVAGLSMGGTLALWLATRRPDVRGLVLVNPFADAEEPRWQDTVASLRSVAAPFVPGIGSDIAEEGSVESAYPLTPVQPLLDLHAAVTDLRAALGQVRCPVLLLTSPQDHVVAPASSDLVARAVAGPVERVALERSFHVATLDHDAPLVEQRAVEFVRRVTA
ncbi:MAG: alpha/beta fold hydrolase [Actinomycetota bacterium]|jgi:carboxylesterase|nr:alpha/beta fold hydrolase [Actinomycetota bacterium]